MTATESIDNYTDVLDSRDIDERIEFLTDSSEPIDDDEAHELATLAELRADASPYAPDWAYGEALIRDSYFITYAQELAEDCGLVNEAAAWPTYCIDWDRAARELQMDYTSVDFDGVTYWIR